MASTQNLEISIGKINAGMRRANELKAEMKSILQLLSGYLSDHAQGVINGKAAVIQIAEHDDWYDVPNELLINPLKDDGGSLAFKVDYGGRNKVDFRVFYIEPTTGEPTAILTGTRIGDSARTDCTITPEVLAADYIGDCYRLVEFLFKEVMRLWYPEELGAEVETFYALSEM